MFFIKNKKDDTIHGPYTPRQIRHWLRNRHINLFTPAKKEEDEDWKMVGSFVELSLKMDEMSLQPSDTLNQDNGLLDTLPFSEGVLKGESPKDTFVHGGMNTRISDDVKMVREAPLHAEVFPQGMHDYGKQQEAVEGGAIIQNKILPSEVSQIPAQPEARWHKPVNSAAPPPIPQIPHQATSAVKINAIGTFVKKIVNPLGRFGQYRGTGSIFIDGEYIEIQGKHVYPLWTRVIFALGISIPLAVLTMGALILVIILMYFIVEYLLLRYGSVRIPISSVTRVAVDPGRGLVAVEFPGNEWASPVVMRTHEWRNIATALCPPGTNIDAMGNAKPDQRARMIFSAKVYLIYSVSIIILGLINLLVSKQDPDEVFGMVFGSVLLGVALAYLFWFISRRTVAGIIGFFLPLGILLVNIFA